MSQTREEIIKRNVEFMYGRKQNDEVNDPDKHTYIRSSIAKQPAINDDIVHFTGEFDFLAPSFPCEVFLKGCSMPFPSYEHAFQASKVSNPDQWQEIRETSDVRKVKSLLAKVPALPSWKDNSLKIAEMLLRDKFIRQKALTQRLMKTGHRDLIFNNGYGDQYWGVVSSSGGDVKGKNMLGLYANHCV